MTGTERAMAPGMLEELQRRATRGADEVRAYLASPEGERLRRRVAQALIVTAPLLVRSRVFRATWPGRILGVVGGAAVLVKVAEALRDWDPVRD
jgi:hypothetical protein